MTRRRLFEGEDPPPVASRAPTPNVSTEQLPPPDDDDEDDQPPILRPGKRPKQTKRRFPKISAKNMLKQAKWAKRRKLTPEQKADKFREKIEKERSRPWKWGKDIVGRKIRVPKDMNALLFFKMICAHKRTGRYPVQMLQYAPDRIVAETCNICYRALRDPDVYFTKAQQTRLRKMKGIISDLAYKRLPTNLKRNIIQRGGFAFASILPMITKVMNGVNAAATEAVFRTCSGM